MALKPVLKLKVDELFLRWLSEPDTQSVLRANLKQIVRGEPVSGATRPSWPQSPRQRPASPSSATPPCSPMTASPRSPRRPIINKASIKQLSYKQVSERACGVMKKIKILMVRKPFKMNGLNQHVCCHRY